MPNVPFGAGRLQGQQPSRGRAALWLFFPLFVTFCLSFLSHHTVLTVIALLYFCSHSLPHLAPIYRAHMCVCEYRFENLWKGYFKLCSLDEENCFNNCKRTHSMISSDAIFIFFSFYSQSFLILVLIWINSLQSRPLILSCPVQLALWSLQSLTITSAQIHTHTHQDALTHHVFYWTASHFLLSEAHPPFLPVPSCSAPILSSCRYPLLFIFFFSSAHLVSHLFFPF